MKQKHECGEMKENLKYANLRLEIAEESRCRVYWKLMAYDDTTSDPPSLVEFKATYCPFCGLKLGEER